MSKPTVHFIYATPHTRLDRVTMKLWHRKVWRSAWDQYRWPTPIWAPLCITYHLADALSRHFNVKLYDLQERVTPRPRPGDILLGHPCPDKNSVLWKALDSSQFLKKYVIAPYNHDPRQTAWVGDAIAKADRYFALCGQFWVDTFDRSPLAQFRDKLIRVNMGIDTADYPLVKTSFNPEGKRRFFYVGRAGEEKGLDLLEQLAAQVPGFEGGYICRGADIKGWKKISEPTRLTPALMSAVAADYDIFINMSRFDAQVTTVLEAMSWGFPVACTRESGYSDEPGIILLDANDPDRNVEILSMIQSMSGADLARIAEENRKTLIRNYNCQQFVSTVVDRIIGDCPNTA